MITKKQIRLTPKKIFSWLTMITIFSTMIILIFISSFLYKNFYQAVTQTKNILVLREKVALDTINMKKFDLIIDKLTKKTQPKELNNINSPFR